MRAVDAASPDGVLEDLSLYPSSCPKCGGETRPNLRGGDWFNHRPYEAKGRSLLAWLDECVEAKLSVAVIEVGCGPNTPIVTSIPACGFSSAVAAAGGSVTYLRVNPDPLDHVQGNLPSKAVQFFSLAGTWSALKGIIEAAKDLRSKNDPTAQKRERSTESNHREARAWQERYTEILSSLRTPR